MSYGRHRVQGEKPSEVFIVTNGNWHKLYSTISAARGVATQEKKYGYPKGQVIKILKVVITDDLEEIPHEIPEDKKKERERKRREKAEKLEYERLKEKFDGV
jgi:hypothetical protein